MTKRVTTDPEVLAAWPNRGRCWKLVARWRLPELRPWAIGWHDEDYSRYGEWLKAQGSGGNPLAKFHCFTSLQDARSAFLGVSVVQEFEYEGLSGIGHFQTRHTPDEPLVVLLVEYVKPLNVITLPVSVGQAETDRIAVSQQ